jgi:hypothetical protein
MISKLIAVLALVVGVVVGSAGVPADAQSIHHASTSASTMRVASDWWA